MVFFTLGQQVKQMPRACLRAKQFGLVLQGMAESAQQGGALFQPNQRVAGGDLKSRAQFLSSDLLQTRRIGLQR